MREGKMRFISLLCIVGAACALATNAAQAQEAEAHYALVTFFEGPAPAPVDSRLCVIQTQEGLNFVPYTDLQAAQIPVEVLDQICGAEDDQAFLDFQIELEFGAPPEPIHENLLGM